MKFRSTEIKRVSQDTTIKISIYRPEAIQRHRQSREESVFPRLVSPCFFTYLWILLGLLLTSGIIAWFAQVPVYASGLAIVVDWRAQARYIEDNVALVALLPLEDLQVGQKLLVHLGINFLPVKPSAACLDKSI